MNRDDISDFVATCNMDFLHFDGDGPIVAEDQMCSELIIVVKGQVVVTTIPDDHSYRVDEELTAPFVIQPDRLFGLRTRYSATFSPKGKCSALCIPKTDVVSLTVKYQVFRINLFNAISTLAQKQSRTPWRHTPDTLRGRIVRFVETHCVLPTGRKRIVIRILQLTKELNASRRAISDELHNMEADGLITMRRECIIIPSMEKLLTGSKN